MVYPSVRPCAHEVSLSLRFVPTVQKMQIRDNDEHFTNSWS